MTQEAIIRSLQNGSLTSYQIENLTGIPRLHIVAACKHLHRKKKITVEKIKLGRSWVCRYTLEPHMIEVTKAAKSVTQKAKQLMDFILILTHPSEQVFEIFHHHYRCGLWIWLW
jgi:hypothetical protein